MQSTKRIMTGIDSTQCKGLVAVKSMTNLNQDAGKSFSAAVASKNFQKYELVFSKQQLQDQIKFIQWRSKTEFPIVKVMFYKILHKKPDGFTTVQLAIQNFPSSLSSLSIMPLFQILYLMKQSLIGFERLYDRFGAFDVTNKMIFLNKTYKCKVWFDESISKNCPLRKLRITQRDFSHRIIKLFQEKCIKSTLSTDFFNSVLLQNRIVDAIQFIDNFTKNNRIILADKLNSIHESLGAKRPSDNAEAVKGDMCFGHQSLKKIPKFITQMRNAKKIDIDSKSFDSPNKKVLFEDNLNLSYTKSVNHICCKKEDKDSDNQVLTPKSRLSHELKEDNSDDAVMDKSPKRLFKQISHQNFGFSTTNKHFMPKKITMNRPNAQSEGVAQQLFFTKLPVEIIKKNRKLSNAEKKLQFCGPSIKSVTNIPNQEKSIQSSQQTSATNQPPKRGRRKVENQTKEQDYPGINILKCLQRQQNKDIFQKNGWLKRFNNLFVVNFRDTIHSHFDGHQTFSDELLFTSENLSLLGMMGKQLKGSFAPEE